MPKVQRLSQKPGILTGMIFRGVVTLILVFCVVSIVSVQNSLEEKKRKKIALQEEIDMIAAENEELNEILQSEDISRYMEKLAVENGSYSYAYPDERRYYDTSRD